MKTKAKEKQVLIPKNSYVSIDDTGVGILDTLIIPMGETGMGGARIIEV